MLTFGWALGAEDSCTLFSEAIAVLESGWLIAARTYYVCAAAATRRRRRRLSAAPSATFRGKSSRLSGSISGAGHNQTTHCGPHATGRI
jgi:hypothetical protein